MRPDGSIRMSQTSYIQGIQPMDSSSFTGKAPDEEVVPAVATEYKSVLGAVAYAMMTQFHLLVYVVAAQRQSHKPTVLHCRRVNALLSHMKKHPRDLIYASMECARSLATHSDPGFTREEDKGYGIRAANHLHEMQIAANKLQDFQLAVASVSDKKIRPKKYKCDQCNACFSNNGQLRGHVRIHTGMV